MHRWGEGGCAGSRQREGCDQHDSSHHRQDEDAALGTSGAAAHPRAAHGVRRQQAVCADSAAVGNAEEEGLCPVPCRMQSDGPPQ